MEIDHAHQLNLKTADALVTMPRLREPAFSPVHFKSINMYIFVRRTGELPDGSHQVYALDMKKLRIISGQATRVRATFTYVLSLSPLAPKTIWAVVTDIDATKDEPDPIVAIHASGMAQHTVGKTVIHFVDEGRMRDFVRMVENN